MVPQNILIIFSRINSVFRVIFNITFLAIEGLGLGTRFSDLVRGIPFLQGPITVAYPFYTPERWLLHDIAAGGCGTVQPRSLVQDTLATV
jgi:hypothetical protein